MLASCVQGSGFNPLPSHTKDFKNGTQCFPAWHSELRVSKIEGKWRRERSDALPYLRVVAIERGTFGSPPTAVDKNLLANYFEPLKVENGRQKCCSIIYCNILLDSRDYSLLCSLRNWRAQYRGVISHFLG